MTTPSQNEKEEIAMWTLQYKSNSAVTPLLVNVVKAETRTFRWRLGSLSVAFAYLAFALSQNVVRHDWYGMALVSTLMAWFLGFAFSVWRSLAPSMKVLAQTTRDYLLWGRTHSQGQARLEQRKRPAFVVLWAIAAVFLTYAYVHTPSASVHRTVAFTGALVAASGVWAWRHSIRRERHADEMAKSYEEALRAVEEPGAAEPNV